MAPANRPIRAKIAAEIPPIQSAVDASELPDTTPIKWDFVII